MSKSFEDKFARILNDVKKVSSGTFASDPTEDRVWRAATDKAGNGYAVIRFLPDANPEGSGGFVSYYSHGFQGPTSKWYIENCPTTINKPCPACEENGILWNSGVEANKDIVRKRKRRQTFVSNILVIEDPANPENEGKVFVFKYGKKIFEKIKDSLCPAFKDEKKVNPFCPDEGANFKLKIRRVEGYANFDKSEFESQSKSPKYDSSELVDLTQTFTSDAQFKPYEALKTKIQMVLFGGGVASRKVAETFDADEDEAPVRQPAPKAKKIVEDDDDDLSYLRRLAEED